jgi:hypothetical protein
MGIGQLGQTGIRACSVYVLRAARKAQRTARVRPEIVR